MSNLSDLDAAIKGTQESNNKALKRLGALIGTVADFAGAVGAIFSAVQLVDSLTGGGDQTQALLQDILTTIQTEFHKLNLDLKAEDLLAQWRDIDTWLVPAEAVFDQLQADLTATPPLDSGTISNRILTCWTAVKALGQPDKWRVVQGDQVYFAPTSSWLYKGGGLPNADFPFTYENLAFVSTPQADSTFAPQADAQGLAFNYIYILPAYLRALMIFLTVGATFEKDFRQKYADELREAVGVLLTVHDTIKGGIVNVAAPAKDDLIPFTYPFSASGPLPIHTQDIEAEGDGYKGYSFWATPTVDPGLATSDNHIFDVAPHIDYAQPYGAVNLYSGYNSVGSYLPPGLPPGHQGPFPPSHDGPDAWPPENWYSGFFGKYLLRTLKRSKDVYREVGLPEVRAVINRLKTLVGDPPLEEPSFADWSLRELYNVLGSYNNPLIVLKSVLSLAEYLENTPPLLDARPTSLRQMLEEVP